MISIDMEKLCIIMEEVSCALKTSRLFAWFGNNYPPPTTVITVKYELKESTLRNTKLLLHN